MFICLKFCTAFTALYYHCRYHCMTLLMPSTQARSASWCTDCRAWLREAWNWDWTAVLSQRPSLLECIACSEKVTPRARHRLPSAKSTDWEGYVWGACNCCVLVTCVWLYLFACPSCLASIHRHGRAWPDASLTGLFAALGPSALPSTCYALSHWACMNHELPWPCIQGAVADVCLLEKRCSHPPLTEELTLREACCHPGDVHRASPAAAAIMGWHTPSGKHLAVGSLLSPHDNSCYRAIPPVFGAHHGMLTPGIMTTHVLCDSPSFGLEVGTHFAPILLSLIFQHLL